MGIKRKPISEPNWLYRVDYPIFSNYELFSSERWGKTVEWDVLFEHAKKLNNIVHLIDDSIYPSKLFYTYIDILEANIFVFDDLFYYLTGERITDKPFEEFVKIVKKICSRLRFWNMDCHKEISRIYDELIEAEEAFYDILDLTRLRMLREELNNYGYSFNIQGGGKTKHKRYSNYIYEAYIEEKEDIHPLINQVLTILAFLSNFKDLFSQIINPLSLEDFSDLLKLFRESERGKDSVNAWTYDMGMSRERLIRNMENDSNLSPWVNKYLHLRKNEDVITQLFYDEKTDEIINEDEAYNTQNWINLLTVAAILQEYDERHELSHKAPAPKKSRTIKKFREFVKDASRTDEIIVKLHRLIGNQTNTEALRVITKAMWIELINKPTATSIRNEFPTITCKDQLISRCLNEAKPTNSRMMAEIEKEFESA